MVRAIRWIARIWSVFSVLFILWRFYNSGFHPAMMGGIEWIMFIFYPVGLTAGLIRGWNKDILGGSAAVFSIVAWYLVYFIRSGTWPAGFFHILVALPGILYILCWLVNRRERTS